MEYSGSSSKKWVVVLRAVKGNQTNQTKRWALWGFLALGIWSLVATVLVLTPFPEKLRRKLGLSKPKPRPAPEKVIVEKEVEKVVTIEKIVEVPPKDEPKKYYTIEKDTHVARSSKGFDYKSEFKEVPGGLASVERKKGGSYEAKYTLTITAPEASTKLSDLESVNPELGKILPGLKEMLPTAKVSPFYEKVYQNKKERIKKEAEQLDKLLTKHNYYDCETMLEMVHPGSKRKVFLLQGDMDVVSDGTDGDRMPQMPDKIVNSPHYQPFTSYRWDKVGNVENPMIRGWKQRIRNAEKEIREGASSSRKAWLKGRMKMLKEGIEDMQEHSYLIANHDPFVVMPVFVVMDRESAWGPNVGDYVAVIHDKKVYPAIVGDAGPNHKVGEASLRIAKTINPKASAYYRPVSSVGVTYLVFPRSSGKWKEPNYDDWRTETEKLLREIGGLGAGYELHRWENTLAPKPIDENPVTTPPSTPDGIPDPTLRQPDGTNTGFGESGS